MARIIIDTTETHLLDDGVFMLEVLEIPLNNTITFQFQYKEEGQPYDYSSGSQEIFIAVKDEIDSTTYKLDPVVCADDDNTTGKFSYEFDSTFSDVAYEGVVEFRLTIADGEYKTIARGAIIVSQTLIT